MEPAQLVKLAIAASIPLLVFALGMRATFADATTLIRGLFRPPNRLLRAIVSMNIIVPAAAVAVAMLVDLSLPVKTAVLAMAVSPIPPVLPGKQLKVGGDASYVFGLLVAVSLASVVLVPFGVDVIGSLFDRESRFGVVPVVKLVGTTILLPLLAGLLVRRFLPRLAQSAAPWVSRIGTLLLAAGLVPTLFAVWPAVVSLIGSGAALSIAMVVVIAIAAGHWLGGPDPDERSTLALASAMRHPGIAMAIASLNVPEEPRVPAAVILYLLIAAIATSVYGAWWKRQRACAD
jgi:BASS family bile acid:Na+ symporter